MVRQRWIYLLPIFIVLLTGCKKLHRLTQFYMDYHASYTYSSGVPLNLPFPVSTPDVTTNAEQQFAINDTRKDLIESILLKQLTLTISNPANATFSFLKSVSIYISAANLPEVRVAHLDSITDPAGTQLQLQTDDVELQEYIKADAFNLKVVSTTDEIIAQDITVDIYSKFFVDAKILGL